MIELELLGPHGDGSQLVFTDKDGERYMIVVDDALKAAIRRGELKLESFPKSGSVLRPREIQQLLRAGMPAAEIAANYDIDIDRINRFLAPVVTERNYIVSAALAEPVGGEAGAPQLGDLVIDRLATRGVDAHSLSWTALREGDRPWELHLTFVQAATERRASWQVSNRGVLICALDEEARWLTETTTPAATNVTSLPEGEAPTNTPGEAASPDDVEKILGDLASKRGRRRESKSQSKTETVEKPSLLRFPKPAQPESKVEAEEPIAEPEPAQPQPVVSEDSDALPGFEKLEVQEPEPKKNNRSGKRRPVPSWDEIVFGTRSN
ncbi:septation protein SepH [Gleimia europaea]|uniref:septation protein SepH n=1 Tax=Gleimia europaea TaxID=66228 RepID=UPI0013043017|nr:septation protein SepH [Gleimia europaea]WIK63486.1 septation protein SepH [Gleimia europaea]